MAQNTVRMGIVTPTYQRERLLNRFIKQIQQQTYKNWQLAVVHDGVSEKTHTLVEPYSSRDERITYLALQNRSNDFGTTPRLKGASYLAEHKAVDYLVFWDDDNSFRRDALAQIDRTLLERNYPALLLIPFLHENRILPPPHISLQDLHAGHVDSANLVIRADVCVQCYRNVGNIVRHDRDQAYISDFLFFAELREHLASTEIYIDQGQPIGVHDGLRVLQSVRWALRIPKLELGRYQWYHNLKKQCYDWF